MYSDNGRVDMAARTGASIASGWLGGIAGTVGANELGVVVGKSFGGLFGRVDIVPGTAI